jgi:hypothetical protein
VAAAQGNLPAEAAGITGTPKKIWRSGMRTVPKGSMWAAGFKVIRPRLAAVSSPSRSAIQAWADSWKEREKSRTR